MTVCVCSLVLCASSIITGQHKQETTQNHLLLLQHRLQTSFVCLLRQKAIVAALDASYYFGLLLIQFDFDSILIHNFHCIYSSAPRSVGVLT